MNPPQGFTIRVVDWAQRGEEAARGALAVFVVEQNIPEELEWDEFDAVSVHALAEDRDGVPIGCGRLLPDGHIGRLAVLSDWRGQGVGRRCSLHLIELARKRAATSASCSTPRTQAMPFYARYGFAPTGAPFMEAGIAHQEMARMLAP